MAAEAVSKKLEVLLEVAFGSEVTFGQGVAYMAAGILPNERRPLQSAPFFSLLRGVVP